MTIGLLIGMMGAAVALTGAATWAGVETTGKATWYMNEAKNSLQDTVHTYYPELENLSTDDFLNQLYLNGYIDSSTKTKYMNLLKDWDGDPHEAFKTWSKDTGKEVADLYRLMELHLPEFSAILSKAPDYVKEGLSAGIPEITGAPAPSYLNTGFTNEYADKEADPLKWWKGKELAEHHDLHWDLDEMYDAVKQGTAADVVRDEYNSEHQNWTGLKDNHENEVSYIADLRNTKADAITSGATAGARAANELLGMVGNTSQFSQNQAQIVDDRWNTVQQALLADANARVTANNKYMNLGKNIFDNIEYLYANDVDRRGAELLNYADMYAANEALRGAMFEANGSMAGQYAMANANIAAARQGMNDTVDRYKWMWDRFYGRANEEGLLGNDAYYRANSDFFNWAMAEGLSQAGTTYNNYGTYRSARNTNEGK